MYVKHTQELLQTFLFNSHTNSYKYYCINLFLIECYYYVIYIVLHSSLPINFSTLTRLVYLLYIVYYYISELLKIKLNVGEN